MKNNYTLQQGVWFDKEMQYITLKGVITFAIALAIASFILDTLSRLH